jgi:hypothetical protein
MGEQLERQEVAILVEGRKILKAKGLARDADVKTICQAAGISRKTGYQWASKLDEPSSQEEEALRQELARLRAEHEELRRRYDDLSFENEGRKLAWEIHGVDEFLAAKKNATRKRKRKRR